MWILKQILLNVTASKKTVPQKEIKAKLSILKE